jgi:hypothetical protein
VGKKNKKYLQLMRRLLGSKGNSGSGKFTLITGLSVGLSLFGFFVFSCTIVDLASCRLVDEEEDEEDEEIEESEGDRLSALLPVCTF